MDTMSYTTALMRSMAASRARALAKMNAGKRKRNNAKPVTTIVTERDAVERIATKQGDMT